MISLYVEYSFCAVYGVEKIFMSINKLGLKLFLQIIKQ
jgi:hypothetical protein